MLSIMENRAKYEIKGGLELLFTVEEEIGLNGAMNLKPGFFQGKVKIF
jgi:putative aminopeptidase FrvX